jgi:sporulation protein YlmC with PRC-barrel domain
MTFNPSLMKAALPMALLSLAIGAYATSAQAKDVKPAQQCMTDLNAFDAQLQEEGYWLHCAGMGYGYPTYGYGYAYGGARPLVSSTPPRTSGYRRARPGYEIRTLIASANILAKRGDQRSCESLLTSARSIYSTYAADLRSGNVPRVDVSAWRREQIAAAIPVTDVDVAFRSDQLVGAGVVNSRGDDLGSVDDIVMDPHSGKIDYLVIARGGLFGFGQSYVAVPWLGFKATPGHKLMVLPVTTAGMDAAPTIDDDQNFQEREFTEQSQKINAYWRTRLNQ